MSRSKRVLVIEPSRTIRLLLEIYLKKAAHQVLLYSDLTIVEQQFPRLQLVPPEVVFVAVNPLVPDWYDQLRRLRCLWSPQQVVMIGLVSSQTRKQDEVRRALATLPLLYVPKPFQVQDTLALVFAHHAVPSPVPHGGL